MGGPTPKKRRSTGGSARKSPSGSRRLKWLQKMAKAVGCSLRFDIYMFYIYVCLYIYDFYIFILFYIYVCFIIYA